MLWKTSDLCIPVSICFCSHPSLIVCIISSEANYRSWTVLLQILSTEIHQDMEFPVSCEYLIRWSFVNFSWEFRTGWTSTILTDNQRRTQRFSIETFQPWKISRIWSLPKTEVFQSIWSMKHFKFSVPRKRGKIKFGFCLMHTSLR